MSVRVERVLRAFERGKPAVRDASFRAEPGITSLLGPSGSGKSTLLRIIAGLEVADAGRVFLDERDVTDLPARERGVGLVFQSYALFPTMTVFENVAFGLTLRKMKRLDIARRVSDLLARVQLEGLEKRFPAELSGGQRQRVAFARALAVEPRVLLLDEPFGALDTRVRRELRAWLRALHASTRLTTILVTHDQEEALELSSRVVVMNEGRVEQVGTPDEVYDRPATPFVAAFVGGASALDGAVREGRAEIGHLSLDAPDGAKEGDRVRAFVRAHDVGLSRADAEPGGHEVAIAKVERVIRVGAMVHVDVRLEGGRPLSVTQSRTAFQTLGIGEGDRVLVDLRDATVFLEDYAI